MKHIVIILAVMFTVISLVSGFQLWRYYTEEQKTAEQFNNLSARIEQPEQEQPDDCVTSLWTVNDQYGLLFEQNRDMIGWIAINGTGIGYPVMQTPDRPDYYLTHDFDKQRSNYGVPYVAEESNVDPQSDNITIYGHRMKSGKMFGELTGYLEDAFWREHPTICFDTRAGFGVYEILAVFKTTPADFQYHLFVDAAEQAEFNEYVQRCKKLSLYDTGITAEYGDKLISLSTCENSQMDGRLVIVAKKVAE